MQRSTAQNAQAQLAAILESSDEAFLSYTLDGVILSWSRSAERIYGYAADEMIGRSIALLVPPERAAELDMILGRVACGERIEHLETVRVAKDGQRREV